MMRRVVYVWAAISLAAFLIAAMAGLVVWGHGFEARSQPSKIESAIAMKLQDTSIPERYAKMSSPLSTSQIDLIDAGGHYQEHCAMCHGDNGDGNPVFKGTMYPRPTDLRSDDTQEMSDGELYWVIKNGVRWTGMPAFGTPGDDDEHAWKIVAYIRHLPKLTPEEVKQVKQQSEKPMDHTDGSDKPTPHHSSGG